MCEKSRIVLLFFECCRLYTMLWFFHDGYSIRSCFRRYWSIRFRMAETSFVVMKCQSHFSLSMSAATFAEEKSTETSCGTDASMIARQWWVISSLSAQMYEYVHHCWELQSGHDRRPTVHCTNWKETFQLCSFCTAVCICPVQRTHCILLRSTVLKLRLREIVEGL